MTFIRVEMNDIKPDRLIKGDFIISNFIIIYIPKLEPLLLKPQSIGKYKILFKQVYFAGFIFFLNPLI